MDYLFEQLGAESFQHLCQALLLKDYPDLQCFPVGQPDGGRDALSREDGTLPTVVGQIKFKRVDDEDNADWMIEALKGELPKIERLKKRGAARYLMMTNASGTAHLDVGRIDRAQKWLDENSPIPGQVLWRDDLSRRLDDNHALKLAYPSLLTGQYALAMIYEALFAPQSKHLAATMKSFVAEQYRKDSEVKFRQIDLSNSLTALFVDVPVNLEGSMEGNARFMVRNRPTPIFHALLEVGQPVSAPFGGSVRAVGTADLLLDRAFTAASPRIVLQGAPGQGKSTLAQYVCQVHRARLLSKDDFFAQIPARHASAPFRMPFKVDLRDLADFIDGRTYLKHPPEANASNRTFERFLASLVSIQGGSDSFGVDELRSVLTESPALIFLDGLDEVADVELRKELLERVEAGVHRLTELGADLQLVVTSRPAQLGQAAQLADDYTRINLGPLRTDVVLEYADKWIAAKGLEVDHADEVKQILTDKLDLTHIRELTKNPMQLTILLSLIAQIGQSLPDVRTDLYREYVKVFMNREAEKDAIVHAHKQVLLRIVEYLAWVLQSEAETEGASGSISSSDLRDLVRDYLVRAAQGLEILDDLFARGLDRIYVLVQRIEGLYEFEVQPLREYFAAKYLYSSAPVGYFRYQEVHGDRLQRFEAIAGNPYWANVTRFYAGFWEPGEVGALSISLREMIGNGSLEAGLNARAIGSALLTDRTFAVKPFVQDEVIEHIFDPVGVHLAALNRLNGFEVLKLPEDCGQSGLARKIFDEHVLPDGVQMYGAICLLLRENGGAALSADFVEWVGASTGKERSRRVRVASLSGGLDALSVDELVELLHGDGETDDSEIANRYQSIVSEVRSAAARDSLIVERAFGYLRDWGGYHVSYMSTDFALVASMSDSSYPMAIPADAKLESVLPTPYRDRVEALRNSEVAADRENYFGDAVNAHADAVYDLLGQCWAVYRHALIAEGALDAKRRLRSGDDGSASLLDEVLRGRRWRGRPGWWAERIQAAGGSERLFWLGVLICWGGSAQVRKSLSLLESEVKTLSEHDVQRLTSVVDELRSSRIMRGGRQRAAVELSADIDERLARLLIMAFGPTQVHNLPDALSKKDEFSSFVRENELLQTLNEFPGWPEVSDDAWPAWLQTLADAHDDRLRLASVQRQRIINPRELPAGVAARVVGEATRYGAEVVASAVSALQRAHKAEPVGDVAVRESWTFA